MNTYFIIGHSTHLIGEFIAILLTEKIDIVVDVRTIPRSRTNPQFDCDTLPIALAQNGIEYVHLMELGGLRGRQPSVKPSPNAFWNNVSFRNYADYALSDGFQVGLQHLKRLGESRRCVIMCAESLWWRCHRRIIADYLILSGATVIHIMGQGRTIVARATSAAHMRLDGKVLYPNPNPNPNPNPDPDPDPDQKIVGASASADNLHRQVERWVNEGGAGGEDNSAPMSDKADEGVAPTGKRRPKGVVQLADFGCRIHRYGSKRLIMPTSRAANSGDQRFRLKFLILRRPRV